MTIKYSPAIEKYLKNNLGRKIKEKLPYFIQ